MTVNFANFSTGSFASRLLGSYDNAVSGNVAEFIVMNIPSVNSLIVTSLALVQSIVGLPSITASVDNGVTFFNTSGNYVSVSAAGVETASSRLGTLGSANTVAPISASSTIFDVSLNGFPKMCFGWSTTVQRLMKVSTLPINAICIAPSGGGVFSAGQIWVASN